VIPDFKAPLFVMHISDLVRPGRTGACRRIADKRSLIEQLSRTAAAEIGQTASTIAEALNARERLGSTGIGGGVALPHAVLEGIAEPFALLVTLDHGIEFDAVDQHPVDVVFLLLSPATGRAHNESLACAARLLRDKRALRSARDARTDAQLLTAIGADKAP